MLLKNIIRRIKSLYIKEFRIIEPADKRIDQYGNSEAYKEKFYNIARHIQKKYGLKQLEAMNKASNIIKATHESKEMKKVEEKLAEEYLQDVIESEGLDSSDVDVVNRNTP